MIIIIIIISAGRLFQVAGPAALKARLPYVAVRVFGTNRSPSIYILYTSRLALISNTRPFKITVLHKHKSCACTCTESKTLLSYRSRVLLEGSTVGRNNTQRPAFEAGPRTSEVSEFHQTRWINSSPQSQVLRCTWTEINTLLSYCSRVFFSNSNSKFVYCTHKKIVSY